MRKAMFFGLLLLLLATPTLADTICLDNSTSLYSTSLNISSSILPISYNETCQFGCNTETGMCNSYDSMSSTMMGLAILAIAAIFMFVATRISSGVTFRGMQIELVQPLFFSIGFMFILVAFNIMIVGANNSSQNAIYQILTSGYNTSMYTFIFFISFMVISFIYNVLSNAGKKT